MHVLLSFLSRNRATLAGKDSRGVLSKDQPARSRLEPSQGISLIRYDLQAARSLHHYRLRLPWRESFADNHRKEEAGTLGTVDLMLAKLGAVV